MESMSNNTRRRCKHRSVAEWVTAIIGLFSGAIAMISIVVSVELAHSVLVSGDYFSVSDYGLFIRGFVTLIISAIMISNNNKLRKQKKVSTVPYFAVILVFIGEVALGLSTGSFTAFGFVLVSFFPILALVAIINIQKVNQLANSYQLKT